MDKTYSENIVLGLLITYRIYLMDCIYKKIIPLSSEEWFAINK